MISWKKKHKHSVRDDENSSLYSSNLKTAKSLSHIGRIPQLLKTVSKSEKLKEHTELLQKYYV